MRHFKLGLLILSTSLMTACSLPKPSSRDNSGTSATFFVNHSEVKATLTRMITGFSIPAAKTFHFKVCLRDLKRSQELLNQAFLIEGGTNQFDLTTNADGCLEWDEEFAYNHFSEARFVTIERKLTAQGIQKGAKNITYAINPWENLAYDLEKNEVPNLVPQTDSGSILQNYETNSKTIISSDIQMNIIEKKNTNESLDLRVEMRTQPLIEVKKSSKEVVYEPIQEGKFKATLYLYHVVVENDKETRTEKFHSDKIDTLTFKGQISMKFPISLKETCSRGQYYLGLKLEPDLPSPYKMKTFEGLYYVSECDSFKGNFFTRLATDAYERGSKFSLDEYVKETPLTTKTTGTNSDRTGADGTQATGFFISEIRPELLGYKDTDPLKRNLNLRFRACLSSRFDKKALAGYAMEITKLDGTTIPQTSQNDGCFSWDDAISYNYFDKECETLKRIGIRSDKIGLKYSGEFLINPWSGLVRDLQINPEAKKKQPRCAEGESFLFANVYEWKKGRFSYEVDPFLNLNVKKTGVFSMRLFLNRPTLTRDESGIEKVEAPIGEYRLQMALLKNGTEFSNIRAEDILMLKDTVMHIVSRGEISEYFTFENHELKDFGNMTQVYLVITPTNSSANFEPRLYRGDYALGETFEGAGLAPIVGANGYQFMDRLRLLQSDFSQKQTEVLSRLASKENMRREMSLRILNINKPEETQVLRNSLSADRGTFFTNLFKSFDTIIIDQNYLSKIVTTGKLDRIFSEKLCSYWIRDYLEYPWPRIHQGSLKSNATGLKEQAEIECVRAVKNGAEGYFDLQIRDFVKNPKVIETRDGSFQDFSITNGYSMGLTRAHSDTTSWGWDGKLGLDFKFAEVASAGGGVRYSSTHSDSDTSQRGTQISLNGQINTSIETLSLHLKADATERCLIIKVKPEFYMRSYWKNLINPNLTDAEKITISRSGIALCEGDWSLQPKDLVENYYIINQLPKNGQILDPHSDKNRPFFMAIRGDSDYGSFLSSYFNGHDVPETHKQNFQIKNLIKSREKNLFLRDMPGSPGQIITTP